MKNARFVLLMAPIAMAGCAGTDDPPAPRTSQQLAVASAPLIAECQKRFAQSLDGQLPDGTAPHYGEPNVSTVGQVLTVRLTATLDQDAGGQGTTRNYVCTFNGPVLVTAGRD